MVIVLYGFPCELLTKTHSHMPRKGQAYCAPCDGEDERLQGRSALLHVTKDGVLHSSTDKQGRLGLT